MKACINSLVFCLVGINIFSQEISKSNEPPLVMESIRLEEEIKQMLEPHSIIESYWIATGHSASSSQEKVKTLPSEDNALYEGWKSLEPITKVPDPFKETPRIVILQDMHLAQYTFKDIAIKKKRNKLEKP